MDFETYLQAFDDFLQQHTNLQDDQKKEIFCHGLTTRTMIEVRRKGPCSLATAKYRAFHSVKNQRERWVTKEAIKQVQGLSETVQNDLRSLDQGMKTRSPSPQGKLETLQRQQEQRWELAEAIRQKDEVDWMSPRLAEALQNPIPFEAPNYPMPLKELFEVLHIDLPRFATPDKEEDIISIPPTSPTIRLNHMELCHMSRNEIPEIPNDDAIYTSDNRT